MLNRVRTKDLHAGDSLTCDNVENGVPGGSDNINIVNEMYLQNGANKDETGAPRKV